MSFSIIYVLYTIPHECQEKKGAEAPLPKCSGIIPTNHGGLCNGE
jgi:hypothetical protein